MLIALTGAKLLSPFSRRERLVFDEQRRGEPVWAAKRLGGKLKAARAMPGLWETARTADFVYGTPISAELKAQAARIKDAERPTGWR